MVTWTGEKDKAGSTAGLRRALLDPDKLPSLGNHGKQPYPAGSSTLSPLSTRLEPIKHRQRTPTPLPRLATPCPAWYFSTFCVVFLLSCLWWLVDLMATDRY